MNANSLLYIYLSQGSIDDKQTVDLAPILRCHPYGESAQVLEMRDPKIGVGFSLEESDLCFLSMDWNRYLQHKRVADALRFAEEACAAGKVLIHGTKDKNIR